VALLGSELSPQSDLRRRAASRWALPHISSSISYTSNKHLEIIIIRRASFICMVHVFLVCLCVFYVYMGQVPEIKLMMMIIIIRN